VLCFSVGSLWKCEERRKRMSVPSTAITNVRIFDGQRLTEPRAVVLEGGMISPTLPPSSAEIIIDGQGGALLPGLIDSHVHLRGAEDLANAIQYGVTTMLDMASIPSQFDELRRRAGLPDVRTAGIPASGPGSIQTTRMGFPLSSVVTGPDDAERFVAERVAEGSDFIKIIVEDPSIMGSAALDGPTISAIVRCAHDCNLRVYAHVTTTPAMQLAADASVDVLTHIPIDAPLDDALVAAIAARGLLSVPTLVMMRGVASLQNLPTHRQGADFRFAQSSVAKLYRAEIPVLVGTDSNSSPGSLFHVAHGASLHDELELLVAAGLSTADALRGTTLLPSQLFDLGDRGVIESGRRADLVLVEGDPTEDIAATRAIRGVWIAGARVR
jgi:imidazolonepropionase-like amidohydrolase